VQHTSLFSRELQALCITTLLLGSQGAKADNIKPRMLMLVDTSGSMAWDIAGFRTNGDGSADLYDATGRTCCPGAGGSRLFIAKEAMSKMVMAAGDVDFSLMKFPQRYQAGSPFACDACETIQYRYNQTATGFDRLRYYFEESDETDCDVYRDYSIPNRANWLVAPFGDTGDEAAEILSWMDHHVFF
jgi:hypothetical protein